MNKDIDPCSLVARLKKSGMNIDNCTVRGPVSADDREFVSIIGREKPPPKIDALYDKLDGFSLIWHGRVDGLEVAGSINILPYSQSASRAALSESGAPLEGILWTDGTPKMAADELREMAIFESVAGRSQFLTYRVGRRDAHLFFVERDDVHRIVPDFDTTVRILFDYAGAEGVREALTHADWQARLRKNRTLQRISKLR